jgi:hypothetical protein
MGIGKVSSLAVASLAKINTLAKLSVNKISSVTASFAAAFVDNNAVSKSLTTGESQAIFIEETTAYSFTQSSAFTIGVWIKAGWTNNLNTNIHFFAMNKQLSDSEVTTLYNSGTPANPTIAKNIGNLVGYYNFESDGSDTSGNGNETFAINGDSNIEAK